MDVCIDGWNDGWMNGQIDRLIDRWRGREIDDR